MTEAGKAGETGTGTAGGTPGSASAAGAAARGLVRARGGGYDSGCTIRLDLRRASVSSDSPQPASSPSCLPAPTVPSRRGPEPVALPRAIGRFVVLERIGAGA